jgi:hypothetical protein
MGPWAANAERGVGPTLSRSAARFNRRSEESAKRGYLGAFESTKIVLNLARGAEGDQYWLFGIA